MQDEHSKSVRNHLHDALARRNKCHEDLPNFYDKTDLFADLNPVLEDNKSILKAKRRVS